MDADIEDAVAADLRAMRADLAAFCDTPQERIAALIADHEAGRERVLAAADRWRTRVAFPAYALEGAEFAAAALAAWKNRTVLYSAKTLACESRSTAQECAAAVTALLVLLALLAMHVFPTNLQAAITVVALFLIGASLPTTGWVARTTFVGRAAAHQFSVEELRWRHERLTRANARATAAADADADAAAFADAVADLRGAREQ